MMKTFSKHLTRTISLLITAVLLLPAIPVMAEEPVYVYESIDISAKANSKFYIDPTDQNDTRTTLNGQLHFLHDDNIYATPNYKGAKWPLSIRTHSDGDGFPAQNGFISADNNRVIVSNNSGVSYTLPAKNTDTQKEIIVVEEFSRYSYGFSGKVSEVTVNASGNYDKIHVLVANAVSGTNRQPFNITATYTNGETTAISVENLPKATAAEASANENFVADLTTYSRKHNRDTSTDPDTYEWHTDTPSFTEITDSSASAIALYEYELDLDSSLTLQSIKFHVTKNISSKTVGIVAVTGSTDWSGKITEAEAAIDAAVADSENIEKVLAAVDSVNEIKSVGIDVDTHISNIADYNALFSGAAFGDVLLDGVYGNTEITWDNTETILSQTESIVDALETSGYAYDDLSSETKTTVEDSYTAMVDALLDSDAETDVLKERFELLKDTEIDVLSNIFKTKVIWTEEFTKTADPDLIVFDIDFSQPVTEDKLNIGYIPVSCGDTAVNPAYVTYEAKMTESSITGVKVKIINTLDYSKAYTITIAESLTGANGGEWAYPQSYTETVAAPIAADPSGLTVADDAVSGTLQLTNSTGSAKPYVVLIAAYSADNKMLASKPISGSMPAGASNVNIEFDVPENTQDIFCYVLDSYENLSLLCALCELK